MTQELALKFGLNIDEYQKILNILGRAPNITELGIFSVMWSEHCSYKSTKLHLKKLPTTAPWVVCGPGENAGVIDIGDNQVAIFKMESHNHPSYIEPYQGAATGVGGILRDIFTMGARPIANLNALRFGDINHPKTKHLLAGVVAGISGYGNAVGVPTVGGECNFHSSYNGNILVNAMSVGITTKNKVFYSKASIVGSALVYVGSKTGKDGIHGATMASASFAEDVDANRPTVQVGDPFCEKLLIEACLELMQQDAILCIQDMGAAGLTSSALEMAAKGGTGVYIELDKVPTREPNMSAYEIMLSESQERMLMVLKPECIDLATKIFHKWNLEFSVIGKITDSKCLVLMMNGIEQANMPIAPLNENAPIYDRPYSKTKRLDDFISVNIDFNEQQINESLLKLLASSDICSKKWVYEQYDSTILANTLRGPGIGAAIVRIENTNKALALTSNCTPRYCFADPTTGGMQAVAESFRNLIVTGAKPLAITNCLNFGNPQNKEIMGQLVDCLEGMKEACEALDYPVVSGNVSLYNETNQQNILPTPTIGGVGLISNLDDIIPNYFTEANEIIIVIGKEAAHLGSSLFLREILGSEEGAPPKMDLKLEKLHASFITKLIKTKQISCCNDISGGGLYVTVAKMVIHGTIGTNIIFENKALAAKLFGEDQARYIISCKENLAANIIKLATDTQIEANIIGKTIESKNLILNENHIISIESLVSSYENTIAKLMS